MPYNCVYHGALQGAIINLGASQGAQTYSRMRGWDYEGTAELSQAKLHVSAFKHTSVTLWPRSENNYNWAMRKHSFLETKQLNITRKGSRATLRNL